MKIHKAYGHWSFEWLTTSLSYSTSIEQKKGKNPQNKDHPLTLPRLRLTKSCPQQSLRHKHQIQTTVLANNTSIRRTPREAFPTMSVRRAGRRCRARAAPWFLCAFGEFTSPLSPDSDAVGHPAAERGGSDGRRMETDSRERSSRSRRKFMCIRTIPPDGPDRLFPRHRACVLAASIVAISKTVYVRVVYCNNSFKRHTFFRRQHRLGARQRH